MAETRYSDNDLQEFQALIEEKLAVARENYDELQRALSHSDDNTTDDTAPTFKMMEDGSETMSREETAQLAARQQKFIVNLENALLRIKNKTYGICRVTGKLIPKARLRLVPTLRCRSRPRTSSKQLLEYTAHTLGLGFGRCGPSFGRRPMPEGVG